MSEKDPTELLSFQLGLLRTLSDDMRPGHIDYCIELAKKLEAPAVESDQDQGLENTPTSTDSRGDGITAGDSK